MKDNIFLNLVKEVDPNFTMELPTTKFIDTGSLALNALCSASLYGGFPDNRMTMIHGPQASGKSFLCLSGVKAFLQENPDGWVLFFDTEFAVDKEFFKKRNIDPTNIMIFQPEHLQDFREKCLKVLNKYEEVDKKDRPPMIVVFDSLGMLPTKKEVEDSAAGNDVRDMTKAQVIRSIFRTITLKMGKLNVAMMTANHSYDAIGSYVPTKVPSGGGGALYASSLILSVTKKKDKDGNDVVGNIIKVKTDKSRYSKEEQRVELKLNFETGLDRYYGLLEIAEAAGIFKKVSTRYELPDGSKVFGKNINEDPEKYFTQEVLAQIEKYVNVHYALGEGNHNDEDLENTEDQEVDFENTDVNTEESD